MCRLSLGSEAVDQAVADDMADPVLDRHDLDRRHTAAARLSATRAVERLDSAGTENDESKNEGEGGGRPAPEAGSEPGERPIR